MAASPRVTQDDMVGRLAAHGVTVNQSQIAKMENGERPICDYELDAIAKALKVPIQAFFEQASTASGSSATKR